MRKGDTVEEYRRIQEYKRHPNKELRPEDDLNLKWSTEQPLLQPQLQPQYTAPYNLLAGVGQASATALA